MTDLVSAADIESIVGVRRHRTVHLGRAVSATETVYILHSRRCLESGIDLRVCKYSLALDHGIEAARWVNNHVSYVDVPVILMIENGRVFPAVKLLPNEDIADGLLFDQAEETLR